MCGIFLTLKGALYWKRLYLKKQSFFDYNLMGLIFLVVTGSQKIIQFIILTFCSFFKTSLVVIITHNSHIDVIQNRKD